MSHPDITRDHTPTEGTEGINPIDALSSLKTTSRANIVADIVGHPKGMPSKTELNHMNPSLAPSTISEHLRKLEDVGIVESVRVDRPGNARDAPESFYYLTDAARDLFDRNNLFDEDAYKSAYEEVKKPENIREAEAADRPPVDATTVTN